MSTLSIFERFIAINFSELRAFIKFGPDHGIFKSTYENIKNEINSKNIRWNQTDVDNAILFASICKFFELFSNDKGDIAALISYIEVALGYRYSDEAVVRGLTTSNHENNFKIIFEYAGAKYDGSDENKKFKGLQDSFLSIVNKDNRYSAGDLSNWLDFLKKARNCGEHSSLTPEKGFVQVKLWLYSYIYAIYTYMFRIYVKSEKRDQLYKDIPTKYWVTIYVPKNMEVYKADGATVLQADPNIEPEEGYYGVKLFPFTDYKYKTRSDQVGTEFQIDNFSQYGKIIPPVNSSKFRIMFENTILGIHSDKDDKKDGFKKELLEGIRDLIKSQNEEWNKQFRSNIPTSKDVEKAVEDIHRATKNLIPLINASKEELKALKVQVADLDKLIKSIGFDNFKEEIANKIYSDSKAYELIHNLLDKLDQFHKDSLDNHKITHEQLKELIILIEEREKRRRKRIKFLCWTGGILGIVAVFGLILRLGTILPEWSYPLADFCGNKDAAYNNAVIFENERKYAEAASWYQKAREKYARILVANPNDSIRALRLAEMTMRGKGGIINTDTAQYYAHMAKRYDIEALLAIFNGDVYKAKDLVNNFHQSKSAYFELADALSTLLYPKDHSAEEINYCWSVVDSLAYTPNEAAQEALECAYTICGLGVVDKDEYIISPSLYDAIAYAQNADSQFNSVRSQIFLASKFAMLHLNDDAKKYHAKALENKVFGYGEIMFSQDRINELTDDPQALLARAYNNSQKGYTDYRMTAYYYHVADSINTTRRICKFGNNFYTDWFNYIVDAADINDIDKIIPLINREYSDSMRLAMAEYVMAVKYAKGKGTPLDMEKSREHLEKAADLGLEDAQVAIGVMLDLDSVADGMKILEKLAFRERSKIHPAAARYILSKYYKQGEIIPELLKRSQDEFALVMKINTLDVEDLGKFSKETLISLRNQINIVLSKKTDFYDTAFLLGKLAEIEYLLGHKNMADFYIGLASEISPEDAYSSYYGISEIARKSGDIDNAAFFADIFAKQYFLDKGRVRYEPARHQIITVFYHLYPELLDLVSHDKGFDFANSGYILHETNFERDRDFSTYEFYVGELPIELPDYEEVIYPVTLKYFD